jgi:hypothetical protein
VSASVVENVPPAEDLLAEFIVSVLFEFLTRKDERYSV